jgi:hypothetical protein
MGAFLGGAEKKTTWNLAVPAVSLETSTFNT